MVGSIGFNLEHAFRAKLIMSLGLLMVLGQSCKQSAEQNTNDGAVQTIDSSADHYTFRLSDKVVRSRVKFKNRYGITLSGDLYMPKTSDRKSLSAIVIGGPFGAVKEQSSGLYANQLAERGFVTLAFDPSFTGESGGEPHNTASPDIYTEDMSAGVDFLGLQPSVDRNRIGMIGICGSGGFALNATAVDKRVKAVATAAMYDISRGSAKGLNDSMTPEQRAEILKKLGEQRWKDAGSAKPFVAGRHIPDVLPKDADSITKEFWGYYKTPRGYHKNAVNSNDTWVSTMSISFMNMPQLTYIKEISPRPVLIISGANAHSRYFSEDAFKMANQPKKLLIVPNANHVDLYDQFDKIPFDTLELFFKDNLK